MSRGEHDHLVASLLQRDGRINHEPLSASNAKVRVDEADSQLFAVMTMTTYQLVELSRHRSPPSSQVRMWAAIDRHRYRIRLPALTRPRLFTSGHSHNSQICVLASPRPHP